MNDVKLTALRFSMHTYEVRPRTDRRGVDLISDVLLFSQRSKTKPEKSSSRVCCPNEIHPVIETDRSVIGLDFLLEAC